ncbi:unnamed protein product [Ectocarpus sp. 8 AP-2014]
MLLCFLTPWRDREGLLRVLWTTITSRSEWSDSLRAKHTSAISSPAAEGDESEEDAPVLLGSPKPEGEVVAKGLSPEHSSLSPEKATEVHRPCRAQLSFSAWLDSLVTESPGALEDIQRVMEAPVA